MIRNRPTYRRLGDIISQVPAGGCPPGTTQWGCPDGINIICAPNGTGSANCPPPLPVIVPPPVIIPPPPASTSTGVGTSSDPGQAIASLLPDTSTWPWYYWAAGAGALYLLVKK